ncbi:DNA adenine methylase [Olsenella sp. HMSC062G07]|uniref:DNA adenine methylase n=1 Tax=Olsenella sp. HMSC062G07 TaxID=1739330 RepID=UPI00143C7143|nr:DNA adenine methylase [Olsenella sp. HMSC062G07]
MTRYGVPYKGSKNSVARWVVDVLHPSHTLVDLFAGGCVVTHAAMLSGKWDEFVANDTNDVPQVFLDAIDGKFADYDFVPAREEFNAAKDDDTVLSLLYSFGNDRKSYLWSRETSRASTTRRPPGRQTRPT